VHERRRHPVGQHIRGPERPAGGRHAEVTRGDADGEGTGLSRPAAPAVIPDAAIG